MSADAPILIAYDGSDAARRAIREGGGAVSGVSRWLITGARSVRQSGAELFVTEGTRRSVVVRILPATIAEGPQALVFFRRELLYIADMLDSTFEYQPRLPSSPLGPLEDRRIQDRYSVLWRCSVEGRLAREGALPEECHTRCLAQFRILFPSLGNSTQECFDKIFKGPRPLHSVFVAMATEPEVAFGLQHRSPSRRRRCPLCGFHTTPFEPAARDLPLPLCRAIRLDFPGWKAEMGLCLQCPDVHRALSLRMAHGVPCCAPTA